MRKAITESTVLFLSIIKWVFLATVAGAIVGVATGFFLKILEWGIDFAGKWPGYFLLLPVALFASSLVIKYLAPNAEGHGTEKVIEAIHKNSARIPPLVVPVKLLATVITLALGGSAGKEGPCAQIGAGLTSIFSDLLKFDEHDRKKLVICGISAGFAAVFGTPIAGSIFGVEVLVVGSILYEVLLPSFIAGITAYQVSSAMGVTYFHQSVNLVPVFSEAFLFKVMGSGLFFGVTSILLIEALKAGERLSAKIHIWKPLKGLVGGLGLVGLTFGFSREYLGLGLRTIESSFRGQQQDWYAFLLKPVFTAITLAFGGSGGIVTPIFFVGSTAGTTFARLFGLDVSTFAAIGLVSVLAGAANTPIAASIMSVELFGPAVAPYATVACVVSFLISGHRSVYPSQLLGITKSRSLQVDLGKEIEDIQSTLKPNERGLVHVGLALLNRIERLVARMMRESPDSGMKPDGFHRTRKKPKSQKDRGG